MTVLVPDPGLRPGDDPGGRGLGRHRRRPAPAARPGRLQLERSGRHAWEVPRYGPSQIEPMTSRGHRRGGGRGPGLVETAGARSLLCGPALAKHRRLGSRR
ncbi:hypothetical protein ACRAWD_04450 [Caulobacter segnis]